MRVATALFMALAVTMMAATGCSGAERETPTGTADAPTATAQPEVPGPTPFPFDAVLIEVLGTSDTEWYAADAAERAGELVQKCMARAGFEYAIPAVEPAGAPEDVRTTPEWAGEYGFGVVSGFYDRLEVDGLYSLNPEPNRTYLATLTSAEVGRFVATLYGTEAEAGQLQTDRGCTGEAEDEAFAAWNRLTEVMPNFAALAEERDTHPEWLKGRMLWQQCMAGAGYDYAEPESVAVDVRRRMADLVREQFPDGNLPLAPTADGSFVADPSVVPLLDELQEFEITVAVTNVGCLAGQADRFAAAEAAVQAGFVEHNRDRIDQLLADS